MGVRSTNETELVIAIGAQKAGTTSLHAWLGSLPEISTSRSGKEINFFSRYFDYGNHWYLDHFSSAKSVWLDVSPNYFLVSDLLDRLKTLPLHPRILLLVRDPVARARSQHRHSLVTRPGTTSQSFQREFAANPTYVANGLYGRVLRHLEPLYDEGRLRIVWFNDLAADPAATLEPICVELGLGSRPSPDLLKVSANVSGYSRSALIGGVTRRSGRLLRRFGGEQAVSRLRASTTVERLLAMNRRNFPSGNEGDGFDMDEEELRSYFLDDLRLAEAVTGVPFTERFWSGGRL